MYKSLLKPLLFQMDPEKVHYRTMNTFSMMMKFPFGKTIVKMLFGYESSKLKKEAFGLTFKNPVGLAAGFDKDGRYIDVLALLGFGFIEVGTVTPLPQEGNPKPRLFRLPKDQGLINRMGFNNRGVDHLVEQLKKVKNKDIIIGGNIGKNKVTPNEEAYKDYEICFSKLHPYVDYFVINVSSPNTPGLRALQDKKPLSELIAKLVKLNNEENQQKPILLKIAPDLNDPQIDDIADIAMNSGIDGLIVSNTTVDRSGLKTDQKQIEQIGAGGLSGSPVKEKSNDVLQKLIIKTNGEVEMIGVGGIKDGRDAQEKLDLGASLVQVYSCFIYEGPSMIKRIKKYLAKQ